MGHLTAPPGGKGVARCRRAAVALAPAAATACLLIACARLLRANQIDVAEATGRLLYAGLGAGLLAWFAALAWADTWPKRGAFVAPAARVANRLLALPLLLFAAEAGARALPLHDTMGANPGVAYYWPDCRQRNSLQLNDREPAAKAGPRVLVLGDSYTVGAGVRIGERYSSLLEAGLGGGADVVNAASAGSPLWDQADTLERLGDRLRPDVLVVGVSSLTLQRPPLPREGGRVAPPAPPPEPHRWAFAWDEVMLRDCRSYLYYRMKWATAPPLFQPTAASLRAAAASSAPPERRWATIEEELDRIGRWCDARGVRKCLVVLPTCDEVCHQAFRPHGDRLARAAAARGYLCVRPADGRGDDLTPWAISGNDPHPNKTAHAAIARRLREALGDVTAGYRSPPPELSARGGPSRR